LIFSFEISAPSDRRQHIFILEQFLELSNAHLTVTASCTVSITARSMRKLQIYKNAGPQKYI